jgi:hypothetical protein
LCAGFEEKLRAQRGRNLPPSLLIQPIVFTSLGGFHDDVKQALGRWGAGRGDRAAEGPSSGAGGEAGAATPPPSSSSSGPLGPEVWASRWIGHLSTVVHQFQARQALNTLERSLLDSSEDLEWITDLPVASLAGEIGFLLRQAPPRGRPPRSSLVAVSSFPQVASSN